MKFIILAVILGLFIAFVVMVVKAAKEWRWYHITTAVIAMLLAITLLFPTAGVLKSRQAWHKIKEDLEGQLEQVKQRREEIQYGDPNNPGAGRGLRELSLELSNLGVEAGRRWRNLQMTGANPSGQVTLQKANQQPAVPGAAAPADPNNEPANQTEPLAPTGLVVYGFAEANFGEVDVPMPVRYLGEFKITASTANSVQLTPTAPLLPGQADLISRGQAQSWSLYEMLPLDGHEPFIAEGSVADDDNILGRVDDGLVNQILQNADPETLQNYLRDGKRGAPEDPAARWVKIRFEKKYTKDIDSPEQRGALEGGFFDNVGRAVDSRLKNSEGPEVTFAPGEVVIVKEEAAKELIDEEQVATLVDTYYLRPLNDYRYALRRIKLRIKELDVRIAEMEYEKKVLESAIASTVAMLEKGQIEKLKLEQDLAQYQVETAAIRDYHDQVREALRRMNEAAASLYKDNYRRMRQIQQLSKAATTTDA
jgi:hypothetical protein